MHPPEQESLAKRKLLTRICFVINQQKGRS